MSIKEQSFVINLLCPLHLLLDCKSMASYFWIRSSLTNHLGASLELALNKLCSSTKVGFVQTSQSLMNQNVCALTLGSSRHLANGQQTADGQQNLCFISCNSFKDTHPHAPLRRDSNPQRTKTAEQRHHIQSGRLQ